MGPVALRSWRGVLAGGVLFGKNSAHHGVEVAWTRAGGLDYKMGSALLEAKPGQLIAVNAQTEHVTSFVSPDVRCTALELDAAFVDRVAEGAGRSPRFAAEPVALVADTASLGHLLLALEEEARAEDTDPQIVECMVEALLLSLWRRLPSPATEAPLSASMRAAVELMKSSLAEPLDVGTIAKQVGMSRFHFSRRFREATGRSPYEYLQRLRLTHAATLLERGTPVTVAALDSGFADPGRFARAFRRELGVLPSAYQRTRARGRWEERPVRDSRPTPACVSSVTCRVT